MLFRIHVSGASISIVTLLIACVVLISAVNVQAGMLGSLLKAAKKVETPDGMPRNLSDINFNQLDIDLPHKAEPQVISLKLDLNNNWVLRDGAGNMVTDVRSLKNPVLVIEKFHLPENISQLRSVFPELPLLVRSGTNVYKVKRLGELSVRVGTVHMRANSMSLLHKTLTHLDRPWYSNQVNVVGASLNDNYLGGAVKSAEVTRVLSSPSSFRGQTLVIGGPIKGDEVRVGGEAMSISNLRKHALQYDISLAFLDSPKAISPDKIKQRILDVSSPDVSPSVQTTGDFLRQFNDSRAKTFYQWSPASKNFILIEKQIKAQTNSTDYPPSLLDDVVSHATIHGIIFYRPNEERQIEIDRRWVWWLPSDVSLYMALSMFAGFISFGTCGRLMRKLWPKKPRSEFSMAITYQLIRFLRVLFLLGVLLPVFGLPCFIFSIFHGIYLILRFIFVGIVKFLRLFLPKKK